MEWIEKNISELSSKLSKICSLKYYLETNQKVLYHNGDLSIDELDLDYNYENDFKNALYVVDGNLKINNIYCKNIDRAKGLVVLGDLLVKNTICIGGQIIYVQGDMNVGGMFYGTYNHGYVSVLGKLKTEILVESDEYRIEAKCVEATLKFNEESYFADYFGFPILLSEVFEESSFIYLCDSILSLSFENIAWGIKDGILLIKDYKQYLQEEIISIYSYFGNNDVSYENIDKILKSALMMEKESFSIYEEEFYFSANKKEINEDGEIDYERIYIEHEEYIFFVYAGENKLEILQNISDSDWKNISPDMIEIWGIFSNYWTSFLKRIAIFEHYYKKIEPELILKILQNDYISKLDPYDEYDYGIWNRKILYRFFQKDEEREFPFIDIQDENEVRFQYEIQGDRVLRYIKISDEDEKIEIPYSDINNWQRSQLLFEMMIQLLDKKNNEKQYLGESDFERLDGNPLTKYELDYFEKKFEITLEKDYYNFLLNHNGLNLREENCLVDSLDIRYIFGVKTGNKYNDLNYIVAETEFECKDFYVIADSFGGDYFVQINNGDKKGQIYFWDHEVGLDYQNSFKREETVENLIEDDVLIFVANSFSEVLLNIS